MAIAAGGVDCGADKPCTGVIPPFFLVSPDSVAFWLISINAPLFMQKSPLINNWRKTQQMIPANYTSRLYRKIITAPPDQM